MSNKLRVSFNAPLNKKDTDTQTFRCRANNPEICSYNSIPGVCAFTSEDCVCKHPSRAWKKQYMKLQGEDK